METLQLDRGGSDAARRSGVDVERATCRATRMSVTCQDVLSPCAITPGLSLLQRTRQGVLPCRPRALREAARLNRVRVDCSASSSPEKAGKVTESLRHTGSEGRRGGFPHRAVEAWHLQRRHALLTTFPLAVLNSRVDVGHLEALQCYGVDVVGATCLFSARKPSRAWGWTKSKRVFVIFVSSRRTPSTPSMPVDSFFDKYLFFLKILKQITTFCFPREPLFFFSFVEDCIA